MIPFLKSEFVSFKSDSPLEKMSAGPPNLLQPPPAALTQAQRRQLRLDASFTRAVEEYKREGVKIAVIMNQKLLGEGAFAAAEYANSGEVQAHYRIGGVFSTVANLRATYEAIQQRASVPYAEQMREMNAAMTALSTTSDKPRLGSVMAALDHARAHPPSMLDCLLRQALAYGLSIREAVDLYNRAIAKANDGTVHDEGGDYRLTPNEIKKGDSNSQLLYAFLMCVRKDFSQDGIQEGSAIKAARATTDQSIHADVNDVIKKVNLFLTELDKLNNLNEDQRRKVFTGEDQTHTLPLWRAKKIINDAIGERKDVVKKYQTIADRLSPFVKGGIAWSVVMHFSNRELGDLSSCYIAMVAVLNHLRGDEKKLEKYLTIEIQPQEIAPVILHPAISADDLFALHLAATNAGTAAADVLAKLVLRTSGMAHLGGKQVEIAFLPVTVTEAGVVEETVHEPETILIVTKYPDIVKVITDNHGARGKVFRLTDAGGRFEFFYPFSFRCFTGDAGSGSSDKIDENEPRLMACDVKPEPSISSETLEQYHVFYFGTTGKVNGVKRSQSFCCLGRAVMAALYGVCTGDSMVVERVKNIHNQRMLAIQLAFDMLLRRFLKEKKRMQPEVNV